jgi:hypothetical protein
MFPLFWAPNLSPCLSYQILTATVHNDRTAVHWLGPWLVTISHQPPSLLFTDSLAIDFLAPVVLLITPWHEPTENTALLLLLQLFPWERVCLRRRYSVTAAYTCLLRICCLVADVLLFVLRSLPSNRSTRYIAPSYRRTAISSFPRAVLVTSVIGLAFFPVAQFSRWFLSNRSRCSLLKAVHSEQFPHRVPITPGSSP